MYATRVIFSFLRKHDGRCAGVVCTVHPVSGSAQYSDQTFINGSMRGFGWPGTPPVRGPPDSSKFHPECLRLYE